MNSAGIQACGAHRSLIPQLAVLSFSFTTRPQKPPSLAPPALLSSPAGETVGRRLLSQACPSQDSPSSWLFGAMLALLPDPGPLLLHHGPSRQHSKREKWTIPSSRVSGYLMAICVRFGLQQAEVSRRAKDVKQKILRFQVDFVFYPENIGTCTNLAQIVCVSGFRRDYA